MVLVEKSTARLALLAAAIGSMARWWVAWCEFPINIWNEVRLAPAFALRHGINPYPPLGGGPLSTWIYGPVGILINLPATFADTAVNALHAASMINVLVVCVPLAIVFISSKELRARSAIVPWLALMLGILLIPRPNLVMQVADHSAIALGLLSCWLLAHDQNPAGGRLVLAAGLCALAVWAKQITLFLLPAQLAFLWLGQGKIAAIRYLGWVAFFGAVAFALAGSAFGFGNLWLNVVTIPGRLPWADIPSRLAMRPWSLIAQLILPSLGLIWLWRRKLWPSPLHESGRFFQLMVFAFVCMAPVGLAAYFKIGGDTNLLHSWDYLMPGCLFAWLATDRCLPQAVWRLLGITTCALALNWTDLTALPARPYTAHFESAAQLTATYPHAIWFPRNPLITFYTDHELWHVEDGIQTRFLADYGLRQPDFRRYLPPDLRAVTYPAIVESPFIKPLLSELSEVHRIRYWTTYTRPTLAVKP